MAVDRLLCIPFVWTMFFTDIALSCDIPFPQRGSSIVWPAGLFAAKIKVIKVHVISEMDRYARVRLVQFLKGSLPRTFGVLYDISSCGSHFTQGETRIAGLVALKRAEQTGRYRFGANSFAETWARAVFVDHTLMLIE